MLLHQGFHSHTVSDAVQALAGSYPCIGRSGIHILQQAGHIAVCVAGLVSAAGLEAAAFIVNGIPDALPGGVHHHLSLVTRVLVHYFQHAHVGIGDGIIGMDANVIGPATEQLAVTGIGEIHSIGNRHLAAFVPVTQHIAVRGGVAPDKGHQGFPALLGRFFPVLVLQFRGLPHKLFIFHQAFIGPGIQFLPAQAVESDDNKAGVIVSPAAGYQRRKRQQSQKYASFHSMVSI